MRKLRQRNRFAGNLTAEDIIAIEELETQLSEELDDVEVDDVDVVDDVEVDNVEVETETDTETEQLIKEAQEIMEACEGQDEADEVLKACDELEQQINASSDVVAPDDKEIISEEQEVLNACAEIEAKIAAFEAEEVKTASETTPGIEDEIGDEAKGGDPSVSTITDSKVDVSTDKEVFPTNSEYVAKITARLDRVANILEKRGMKRMAFRVDQLSDKLEASIRK